MQPVRDFEKQLANLQLEATVIANYVYAEMAIHHAASKSRNFLRKLNRTPTLWRTFFAALQTGAYVALGRVFDLKSPYNIEALLASMEYDMSVFSRTSLGERKRASGLTDPSRLAAYLSDKTVPSLADVKRIRRAVERRRAIYDRAFMPVRHRYLAHRQTPGAAAQSLYAKGKVKEMWLLACFLQHLYDELWQLYQNGRPVSLRQRGRYSPIVMYDKPQNWTKPQEQIVKDVRDLVTLIESAP